MRSTLHAIVLVLASLAGTLKALAQDANGPLASGQQAPDCTFKTRDGSALELSAYRDKKVVVLLFMRGFTGEFACTFCDSQTRDYKRLYDQFKASQAEVLMILPGSTDVRGYLRTIGMNDQEKPDADFSVPFPVLPDADFAACKAFDVAYKAESRGEFPVSRPATFVIDKSGKILFAYHGKIPSDRPAVEEVLERVRGKVPVDASTTTARSPAPAPHPSL